MTAVFKVGDRVVIADPKFSGIWIVRKVNPAKYLLDPEGGGRGLNAPHSIVTAAPADGAAPEPYNPYARSTLHPGTLVRFDSPKVEQGSLFVVIADKFDKVNIALLGGDDGRYWRALPQNLTVVAPSDVLR
jgi:hypothetical protein